LITVEGAKLEQELRFSINCKAFCFIISNTIAMLEVNGGNKRPVPHNSIIFLQEVVQNNFLDPKGTSDSQLTA